MHRQKLQQQLTHATVEVQVYQIDAMIRQHSICDANYDSVYDDFDDKCAAVISDSGSLRKIETVNMHTQFGNTKKHKWIRGAFLHFNI